MSGKTTTFANALEFTEWFGGDPEKSEECVALVGSLRTAITIHENGEITMDAEQAASCRANILRARKRKLKQKRTRLLQELAEARREVRSEEDQEKLAPVAAAMREQSASQREQAKKAKAAARVERPLVVGGTKCSSCGKKEARVDDLCKRCAHAAGALPSGKIGGAT